MIKRFTHSSYQCICEHSHALSSLLPDDEVDINGGIDLEGSDFLDNGGWAVDINNSLVDLHLEFIIGVGSLSAW